MPEQFKNHSEPAEPETETEEQEQTETKITLGSETEPKLPEPTEKEIEESPETAEPEIEELEEEQQPEERQKEKQNELKTLLTKLEELTQKKDKTKEETEKRNELISEVKKIADDIAKIDIKEEARKKHEKNKSGESYKKRVENTAVKKAEDENFQAKCVDKLIYSLFGEKSPLTEKEKEYFKKHGKFVIGQGRYSPGEAAGFLANGFTVEQIRSIKWPVWGRIKVPNPVGEGEIFFKEGELEPYAKEGLAGYITEQARKETDEQIVRSITFEMIRDVAETGSIEGKKEELETQPEPEKEAELKKQEVSEEVKDLMQEKLNEEINRLTAEFYDSYIKGKLKKDGKPAEISEEEKTDFILQRIKVDAGKNPNAAELKRELEGLVALKNGLKQEEPLLEANHSALNYFWKKANEDKENIPENERMGYKKSSDAKSDKFYWEENSKIVRELANNVADSDLTEEAKKELPEFLKNPETAEQFEKEQAEYVRKEKYERSAGKFASLFPQDTASQINETGILKAGKVMFGKETVMALVSAGCEAKDIINAKKSLWSDKVKIGNRQFSKSELEELKNRANSVIENYLKKEFEKKWEIRALRTLEENKIKELLKE